MLWYAGSIIIFWTICLLLSWASRKDHPLVDRPAFIVVGMVSVFLGFGVLIGGTSVLAAATPAYGAMYVMLGFIPGLGLLAPWIVHSVKILTDEGQREILGVDQMKIQRSYDSAEKSMHEKRFDDAETEFLAGARREPEDPEPFRRAGEAALAAGRIEGAVGHFRSALGRITSDEDRASLGIRIAEIEERRLNDTAGARRTLEQLLPVLKRGKWGDYVRERLTRIGT